MEDVRSSLRAPSTLALAKVSRQFAGSRIERQVLTQVFDVIWEAGRSRAGLTASDLAESELATTRVGATWLAEEGSVL
jgi:hypothetical protein